MIFSPCFTYGNQLVIMWAWLFSNKRLIEQPNTSERFYQLLYFVWARLAEEQKKKKKKQLVRPRMWQQSFFLTVSWECCANETSQVQLMRKVYSWVSFPNRLKTDALGWQPTRPTITKHRFNLKDTAWFWIAMFNDAAGDSRYNMHGVLFAWKILAV